MKSKKRVYEKTTEQQLEGQPGQGQQREGSQEAQQRCTELHDQGEGVTGQGDFEQTSEADHFEQRGHEFRESGENHERGKSRS